jgi:putative DNA primase/helicase
MSQDYIPEPMIPKGPLPATAWLIKGLVPAGFLTCLKGMPGSFKTFEAVAMACCMATGLPFCGQRTKVCTVLYIAADDPDGPQARAQAWVNQHREILEDQGIPLDLPNLMILKRAVNLHSNDAVVRAIMDIKKLGVRYDVIFIDTLFHSTIGANLSEAKDALPIMQRVRELMVKAGAKSCVLVHHTPKDGKGTFGSVVILASVDVIIDSVWKDEKSATLSCERMRRSAPFKPFDITFKSVKVETEPDDEGITEEEQLVVVSSAPAAKPMTKEASDLESMEWVPRYPRRQGDSRPMVRASQKLHRQAKGRQDRQGGLVRG